MWYHDQMLNELRIRGFRSYQDERVYFGERSLIGLIGQNGSGKSSICEAIVYAVDPTSQLFNADKEAEISMTGEVTSSLLITETDLEELVDFPAIRIAELVEGNDRGKFQEEEEVLQCRKADTLKHLRQAELRMHRSSDEIQQFSEVVKTREQKEHLLRRLARIKAKRASIEAHEMSQQEDKVSQDQKMLHSLKNEAIKQDKLAKEARESLLEGRRELEELHKDFISKEAILADLQAKYSALKDEKTVDTVDILENELRAAEKELQYAHTQCETIEKRLDNYHNLSESQRNEASIKYNRLKDHWQGDSPSVLYDRQESILESLRATKLRKQHFEGKLETLRGQKDVFELQQELKRKKRKELDNTRIESKIMAEKLSVDLEEAEIRLSQLCEMQRRIHHEDHLRQVIMRLKSEFSGVFGYFPECIRVREECYRAAIASIIAEHAESIIVDSVDTAISCCKLLSREYLGIKILLSADIVKGPIPHPSSGYAAIELIDTNPALRGVVAYVLGGAIVVEDVFYVPSKKEGEWIPVEPGNDGTTADESSLIPEEIMDKLKDPTAACIYEASVSEMRNERFSIQEKVEDIEIADAALIDDILDLTRNISVVETQIGKNQNLISLILVEISSMENALGQVAKEIERCEEHFQSVVERHEIPLKVIALQSSAEVLPDIQNSLRDAHANVKNHEEAVSRAKTSLEKARLDTERYSYETEKLIKLISEGKINRDRASKNLEKAGKRLCDLENANMVQESQAAEAWAHQSLYLAHLEEEQDKLSLLKEQSFQVSVEDSIYDSDEDQFEDEEDIDTTLKCDATVAQIRSEIDSLGSSFHAESRLMRAKLEYEAALSLVDERRTNFNEASERLLELQTRRRTEFFNSMNSFQTRLKELYGKANEGGNVQVIAISDKDPWVEGVSVSFIPPKKSGHDLKKLSGGERALASVCILVAARPSQVVIFDELDAALDGENLKYYTRFLISLAGSGVQVIMVSHKLHSFDYCQALVGVWRDPSGVSRTVTIDGDGAAILRNENTNLSHELHGEVPESSFSARDNDKKNFQEYGIHEVNQEIIQNKPSKEFLSPHVDQTHKENQPQPSAKPREVFPGAQSSFLDAENYSISASDSLAAPSPIDSPIEST